MVYVLADDIHRLFEIKSCRLTMVKQVHIPNTPPTLHPIGAKTIPENQWLYFTISATDPDGDSLTYTITGLPSGASFNGITRTFNWIPNSPWWWTSLNDFAFEFLSKIDEPGTISQ